MSLLEQELEAARHQLDHQGRSFHSQSAMLKRKLEHLAAEIYAKNRAASDQEDRKLASASAITSELAQTQAALGQRMEEALEARAVAAAEIDSMKDQVFRAFMHSNKLSEARLGRPRANQTFRSASRESSTAGDDEPNLLPPHS